MNILKAREKIGRMKGRVEVFKQYPDGSRKDIFKKDNLIVDQGHDLVARALGGDIFVNGMYFAFVNGAAAEPAVAQDRTAQFYHTTYATATRGFTRVPLVGRPSFSPSDGDHLTNIVSFTAVSDTTVVGGGPAIVDNTTNFVGAALIFADPNGYADDLAFSCVNFPDIGGPTEVLKEPNVQVGMRWFIEFS
jgi:hypothetical protein